MQTNRASFQHVDDINSESTTKTCPFCAEEIAAMARKCKHCGEFLEHDADATMTVNGRLQRSSVNPPQPSPGVAMVLSLFIPGLGQLYKGRLLTGMIWFVLTVVGYACFILPGLIFHLMCLIDAGSRRP